MSISSDYSINYFHLKYSNDSLSNLSDNLIRLALSNKDRIL